MRTFDPNKKTIEEVLLQHMNVPKYQRPYTWNTEQIDLLLEDLSMLNKETHFLGVIVLHNKSADQDLDAVTSAANRLEIIDGQQRVLTMTILIALIRNLFEGLGLHTEASGLQTLIESPSARGPAERKLKLPDRVSKFFYDYIQSFDNKSAHNEILALEVSKLPIDAQNIVRNYKKLFEEITGNEKWKKNPQNVLLEYRELVLLTEVIEIRVNSEEDAYDLFETLNSRSVRLSEVDMIKNRLFIQLRSKLGEDELEQKWDNIVINVSGEKRQPSDVQKFISHYWWSREKKVSPRQIFRELRTRDGLITINSLTEDAKLYGDLVSTDSNKLLNPRGIRLQDLKLLGQLLNLKQVNVPLLSILRKLEGEDWKEYKTKELNYLIGDLEKFIIAFSLSPRSPSIIEKVYSDNAVQIFKSKNRSQFNEAIINFRKDIIRNFPSREEYDQKITSLVYIPKNSKNNRLISFLLQKVYFGEPSELRFDDSNIDHIFPQNPGWKLSPEEKAAHSQTHELGNLTVLSAELNSRCGNSAPIEKVNIYEDSKILHNTDLIKQINKVGWNSTEIESRTQELRNQIWAYLHNE